MSQIVIINGGTAKDLERFRALADQAIALVEAELPGTVQYECYVAPESSRFVWHESYEDSAAVLAHVQRLITAGLPQQLPEVADFDFAFALGEPSPEASEALAQMGFQVMPMHAKASR
jgi:quinol monooxygenase YgiN